MSTPNDPVILLSYLNTLLRDTYQSLTELCKTLSLDQAAIEEKLAGIGYHYQPDRNRFA